MHRSSKEHLERYLDGSRHWSGRAEFESHIDGCRECREEVAAISAQASLLRVLDAGQEVAAAPGFYAAVMAAIDARRRPRVADAFLDPAFGRRLVYACLASLLVLSSLLFYSVRQSGLGAFGPAASFAGLAPETRHVGSGGDPRTDRELVLVSLASYQE